jgi:hypothetical protein
MRYRVRLGYQTVSLCVTVVAMSTTAMRPDLGPSRLIAGEVRAELGRRQLSNRRFAMSLGVSYAWVNRRISACDVEMTVEDIDVIAAGLDVPREQLLGAWLDTPRPPSPEPTHPYLQGLPTLSDLPILGALSPSPETAMAA